MPVRINGIAPRIATVVVWIAVVGSIWYWTQANTNARVSTLVSTPRIALNVTLSSSAVAKLLSAGPVSRIASSSAADRFLLSGIVAQNNGRGIALISVDGTGYRPFEVGKELAPGFILVGVTRTEAMLSNSLSTPTQVVLSLSLTALAERKIILPAVAITESMLVSVPKPVTLFNSEPVNNNTNTLPTISDAALPMPEVPAVQARPDVRRKLQASLRRNDVRTR